MADKPQCPSTYRRGAHQCTKRPHGSGLHRETIKLGGNRTSSTTWDDDEADNPGAGQEG